MNFLVIDPIKRHSRDEEEDKEDVVDQTDKIRACRGCLETNCKLYDLRDKCLERVYFELTGLPVSNGLACSVCVELLKKFKAFRSRCQATAYMLRQMHYDLKNKTINKYIHVDRSFLKHNLATSKITYTYCEPCTTSRKNISKNSTLHIDIPSKTTEENSNEFIKVEDPYLPIDGNIFDDINYVNEKFDGQDNNISNVKQDELMKDDEDDFNWSFDDDAENNVVEQVEIESIKPKNNKRKKKIIKKDSSELFNSIQERTKRKKRDTRKDKDNNETPDVQTMQKKDKEKRKRECWYRPICEICGQSFRCLAILKDHQTIHTGEKPYRCEYCLKTFRLRNTYMIHCSIHTGERKYKCEHCPRSFRQHTHLVIHLTTHTKEKRHECEICHKRFAVKTNMKEHLRTVHEGLPPKRRQRRPQSSIHSQDDQSHNKS